MKQETQQIRTGSPPDVRNWFGDLDWEASVVAEARSVEDIVAVMRDTDKYPSPVRARGSGHSTTVCGVADGGTVINMKPMSRILDIGTDTVTAEAGAMLIDVAKELEQRGLQFYVNIELGNATIGSLACCATKDASMPGEFGQANSYCVAMKMVTPVGRDPRGRREAIPSCCRPRARATGCSGSSTRPPSRCGRSRRWRSSTTCFKLEDFAE